MTPSILFVDDDECFAVANPDQPKVLPLTPDRPGFVGLVVDFLDLSGLHCNQQKVSLITKSTQRFDEILLELPAHSSCPR